MPTYNTPGVYIEEISKLPASIAPVATAIPAFIGYTELDGEGKYNNLPVRILSMMEYEEKFGGAYQEFFQVTLSTSGIDIGYLGAGDVSPYVLYYQLQMYFANGGGPCYIVSVGTYDITLPANFPEDLPSSGFPTAASNIALGDDTSGLLGGLKACEQEDEITLLCIPEAVLLNSSGRKDVNNAMLAQCSLLQDRFAIMDAFTGDNAISIFDDGNNFRADVGSSYLKYGAAYYPALKTSFEYRYNEEWVDISQTGGTYHEERLSSILSGKEFKSPHDSFSAKASLALEITNVADLVGDAFTINGIVLTAIGTGTPTANEFLATGTLVATADSLKLAILSHPVLSTQFNVTRSVAILTIEAKSAGMAGNNFNVTYSDPNAIATSGATLNGNAIATGENNVSENLSGGVEGINKTLYNEIKKELAKQKLSLYPCGAIAGVYARIDRNRGVWKAPANTSLNRVITPSKLITSEDQESLNIDATSGKSINAIRPFTGKGILVWGARTLAGNDNEWRYVPVRRLYIFVEESVKKATEFVVFEPNTANTWNRVKGMIENFLTKLWREGALAGAKPEDAFFVNIGLGVTMTADDILNGIMNVEIGMAAVRPAEFIILKFSHKLQVS